MPIGQFSKASRLSVKSLRNYDQSGLLAPAFVDPQSGYRYYTLSQLARADAIRSLRMVEMPLNRIAETLDGDDPERLLKSHLVELGDQIDDLNRKSQLLQRLIHQKEYTMSNVVTMKSVPALTAATYRTNTTFKQIFNDIPVGFGTVMTFLGNQEISPVGAPFTMYHQAPDGDTIGVISMCIPVAPSDYSNVDDDSATIVELAGGMAASLIHKGSYSDMGESYANVAAWVQGRGHSIVGPTREIYLNDPQEVAEADLLTELLFPIDAENETA